MAGPRPAGQRTGRPVRERESLHERGARSSGAVLVQVAGGGQGRPGDPSGEGDAARGQQDPPHGCRDSADRPVDAPARRRGGDHGGDRPQPHAAGDGDRGAQPRQQPVERLPREAGGDEGPLGGLEVGEEEADEQTERGGGQEPHGQAPGR